ncbi:hypothetical protein BDP27DRAFT_1320324 [Rhodocollybia butyracea]|uniref:Uncharacterized protein n=1 Tax=Rhodocollybia butyracea TaxID=206335 RepID=A0A9P5Q228_9AGAR|nr:hypothetical protein BDP27DRAFT_1320324 [Rhodocollybia butyracea]
MLSEAVRHSGHMNVPLSNLSGQSWSYKNSIKLRLHIGIPINNSKSSRLSSMSDPTQVRQIRVSNKGEYAVHISAYAVGKGYSDGIGDVQPGTKNIVLDLTKISFIAVFHLDISITPPISGYDPTELTFNKDSTTEAVYVAGGGPDAPTISFVEFRPIPGPMGGE